MVSHGPARKSPFGGMPGGAAAERWVCRISPSLPPASAAPVFCGNRKRAFRVFAARREPEHSRSGGGNAETISMGAAVAHPISPELVLVCPELREHALTLLPALDPEELFSVEP